MIDARSSHGDDERLIDLLVDGELGESERRALLAQLDNEPGGWRRCALAFLEAQSWRREIRLMAGPAPAARTGIGQPPGLGRHRWAVPVRSVLVLAATFLTAFFMGWSLRGPDAPGVAATPPTRSPGDKQAVS